MIDKLLSKIDKTNSQAIRSWWGEEISSEFTDLLLDMLEWDDDGCFQIGEDHVIYYDFSKGRTYRLAKNWEPGDWDFCQKLYMKSAQSKAFRMEVPIERSLVDIEGTTWEYTCLLRPGGFNGETKRTQPSSTEDVEKFVEQYYQLFKAFKELHAEHNLSVPIVFVNHIHEDDQGYYFTVVCSKRNKTPGESINKFLKALYEFEYDTRPEVFGGRIEELRQIASERLGSLL